MKSTSWTNVDFSRSGRGKSRICRYADRRNETHNALFPAGDRVDSELPDLAEPLPATLK